MTFTISLCALGNNGIWASTAEHIGALISPLEIDAHGHTITCFNGVIDDLKLKGNLDQRYHENVRQIQRPPEPRE